MNVRVLELGRETAARAGPAGRLLFAQKEPGQPERQSLLADARRAVQEQRLRKTPRVHRRGKPLLEAVMTGKRSEAHERSLSQRTGSTGRG